MEINPKSVFLDVGCGSSTSYIKSIIPKAKYIGIDIVEYNHLLHGMADTYVKTTPEGITETLMEFNNSGLLFFRYII